MAVAARFYVAEVTKRPAGRMNGWAAPAPLGEVLLRASTSKGNEEWASATPYGEFKMTVRGEALTVFEEWLGRDVSILIDVVPEPPHPEIQ